MRVTELNIYPLKSARHCPLESDVSAEGLRRPARHADRPFATSLPSANCLILPRFWHSTRMAAWCFRGKQVARFSPPSGQRMDVAVWKSIVSANIADSETNDTLSEWLGREVKLVFFDDIAKRIASLEWTGNETPVTFADGYQILVTTTASLAALNDNMRANGEDAVGMERFRPNIVLETDEPWAEDRWAAIEIGGIRFDLVKPCARCIMTTQDQITGSRDVPSP